MEKFAEHMFQSKHRCSTLDGRFHADSTRVITSPEIEKVQSMVSVKWESKFLRELKTRAQVTKRKGDTESEKY